MLSGGSHLLLEANPDDVAKQRVENMEEQVRTALRIAEDDDALFFRAQRLLRWALLGRGAALWGAGRLPAPSAIFDLPWALHEDLAMADPALAAELRDLAPDTTDDLPPR